MKRLIARGPCPAKIALVGEAPGEQEELTGLPFMGASGQDLARTFKTFCGIELSSIYLTNVLMERPPQNKLENWLVRVKEAREEYVQLLPKLKLDWPDFPWPDTYCWSETNKSGYIPASRIYELARLREELIKCRPNLVIAHGALAVWALLGTAGIRKVRGAIAESTLIPGLKVLPTNHIAACYRDWSLYPTLVMDLVKASREAEFPEIRRPSREIWIEPTLGDLNVFEKKLEEAPYISFDCEWPHGLISCVGFSPSPDLALVVPFTDYRKPGYHYWDKKEDEIAAWNWVRKILEGPKPKLAQNGISDVQVLNQQISIRVNNLVHDTMLLHHSIYSESEKGLGFLGSIYTNEASWKLMRIDSKQMEKRDD